MAKFKILVNHTDLEYEKAIDSLIPLAEERARKRVIEYIADTGKRASEKRPGHADPVTGKRVFYNHCFFTEYFHDEMKKLAIENELRRF